MVTVTPYVPESITVHLGAPQSNAENVTVSFSDYIKNVASSEIYPTWDESAILANIYAQISFALNRVYLEYYPSRGYNFNITNSTAYDQSFYVGRNIFENIDRLVDEVFNDYIRRQGFIEPLAARYCNGTTVTCEGLSQWGSEELARQGYNSVDILRYYYGNDIELVNDAPVRGIRASYPGYPLSLGDSGNSVIVIQSSLNRISQDYPSIPKIYPIDGIFGESTQNAVIRFQQIFNLTPDGIVGKATWYKLVMLYVGVNSLAELDSEGQRLFGADLQYPDAIYEGNRGDKVYILQFLLATLAEFYPNIPPINDIDGYFGESTKNAVISFQRNNGLPETGIVNAVTWDEIYRDFDGIVRVSIASDSPQRISAAPFPGTTLKLGSRGEAVTQLQQYLNNIALVYTQISPVRVTGVYSRETMTSVSQYQRYFNIPVTGEVDRTTWNSIISIYRDVVSAVTTAPTQFPGYTLKLGSKDNV